MISYSCKYTPVELFAAYGGECLLLNREAPDFEPEELPDLVPDEMPDAEPSPEPLIIPLDPDIEPDTRMPEEMKTAA